MRIQNIDMAVPVGQGAPDVREEAVAQLAAEEAALAKLIEQARDAARRNSRFVWTRKARTRQREQLTRDMKRIAKRLSSGAASLVSDRHGRAEVRARFYGDLVDLAGAVAADIQQREDRRRGIRWRIAATLVASSTIGAGLWLVTLQL